MLRDPMIEERLRIRESMRAENGHHLAVLARCQGASHNACKRRAADAVRAREANNPDAAFDLATLRR